MRSITIVIVLFMSWTTYDLYGQGNILADTIVWTGSPYIDISQDSGVYENISRFITYGDKEIRWIQYSKPDRHKKIRQKVIVLDVVAMNGTWPDISLDGQVSYTVQFQGNTGAFWIKKGGSNCVIHIEWTDKQQQHQNRRGQNRSYNFEVSKIKIL